MMVSKHYKWELLALLACAFFFHQADRALFSVVLIPIQRELGLTDGQMGAVGSWMFATLAVMVPLAGFLGDRFSRKWIITCSLLFWSFATSMTGLATGLVGLVLLRSVATGGGESFYAPSAYALLASHHKATRSVAFSVHQAALYIGLMCSGYLAGMVEAAWGWRTVFYLFGGLGILLGVVFVFRLKDAPAGERKAEAHSDTPKVWESVCVLVKTPSVLFATLGFCAVVFVNNAYVFWAPAFVMEKFKHAAAPMTLTQAAGGTMLYHHLAAFCAIMAGGLLTDRMVVKHPRFRLLLQGASLLLGAPMIYWIGAAGGVKATWLAMAGYGVFRGLFEVNTHASLFDVVPSKYRSTAVGLMTMTAFFLGTVPTVMIGKFCDLHGKVAGIQQGFSVLACVYVLGAAAIFCSMIFTFRRDRVVE
ncbi:MAG: MFS transporter [Kiritimatiellae bacterium]|nr:MFS transporter [Kiritimatiellia bacterium]